VRDPLRRLRRFDALTTLERLRRLADRLSVAARAAAPYAGPRRPAGAVGELGDLRALLREHHRAKASVATLRGLAERDPRQRVGRRACSPAPSARRLRGRRPAPASRAALERALRPKLWAWVP